MTRPRLSERETLSAPSLRELSRQLADVTEGVLRRIVLSTPGQEDLRAVGDASPYSGGAARSGDRALRVDGSALSRRAGCPHPAADQGNVSSGAIRGSRPTRKRGDAQIPSQSRRRADVTAPPKGGAKRSGKRIIRRDQGIAPYAEEGRCADPLSVTSASRRDSSPQRGEPRAKPAAGGKSGRPLSVALRHLSPMRGEASGERPTGMRQVRWKKGGSPAIIFLPHPSSASRKIGG